MSRAAITTTPHAMQDFVKWLSEQKGFRNRLVRTDADYFKPSRRDEAIARASRPMLIPTVEQIRTMVTAMSTASPVERRNRALVAITIVTSARDNATASLRLKHLDLDDRGLFQDARDVRTKFGKTFPTWFFPVGEDSVDIVGDWKHELERVHGFTAEDPLFPRPKLPSVMAARYSRRGSSESVGPMPTRSAVSSRRLAPRQGFPTSSHSFRHTLAQLGSQLCPTPAEHKAWSQNLGHEGALVTLTSYGTLPGCTQRELIAGITKRGKAA